MGRVDFTDLQRFLARAQPSLVDLVCISRAPIGRRRKFQAGRSRGRGRKSTRIQARDCSQRGREVNLAFAMAAELGDFVAAFTRTRFWRGPVVANAATKPFDGSSPCFPLSSSP